MKYLHIINIATFALALIACSGGGTGLMVAGAPALSSPEQPDYSPDASRQLSAAADSTELYVEQDFSFVGLQTVHLDAQLPAESSRTAVRIFDGTTLMQDWSDADLANIDLLFRGFSDVNGRLQIHLEIPVTVQRLLIEANATGFENKVLVAANPHQIIQFRNTEN